MEDLDSLCPKPPPGPLQAFRDKAGFDWRRLRVLIHGEELLRMKMRVWRALELEPIFSNDLKIDTLGLENKILKLILAIIVIRGVP